MASGFYVLFSQEPALEKRVRKALSTQATLRSCADWRSFERLHGLARCSVVVARWLESGQLLPRLSAVKARRPLNPIVLVTSSDRENARCLKDLTVEEVVWTDELEAQLLVAVKRAEGTGLLEATASTVEQCDHLPPKLREALALVCRSWPPMRSVAQLARAVHRDRSTLWEHWTAVVGRGDDHPRLEDFLGWAILLRAAALKAPGITWQAVGEALSVHEQRIGRTARRLAGVSLRELESLGRSAILRQFVDFCQIGRAHV